MKKFLFTCKECETYYEDESLDHTHEAECPHCGEWNYNEGIGEVVKKMENKFHKCQPIAREISIGGMLSISLGYTVVSIGETIKIVSNYDQETSVFEYDPKTGKEAFGYVPGATSRIVSLKEFAEIIKEGRAEFEGEDEELLDVLLEVELSEDR